MKYATFRYDTVEVESLKCHNSKMGIDSTILTMKSVFSYCCIPEITNNVCNFVLIGVLYPVPSHPRYKRKSGVVFVPTVVGLLQAVCNQEHAIRSR